MWKSPMKLWNVGIFEVDADFDLEHPIISKHIKTFSSKKFRFKKNHIHTIADPFLFVLDNELYLFVEINKFFERGYIVCYKTADLYNWSFICDVLKKPYHISFPNVFEVDGNLFMLPETGEANELALWKFEKFPYVLNFDHTILKGKWYDPAIIFINGFYYLFVTSDKWELNIFISKSLKDDWQLHPASPYTSDKSFSRNGGTIVQQGNNFFRIAQNCANEYGGGIVIKKILELTPTHYAEKTIVEDLRISGTFPWQQLGRHHLSIVNFKGKKIVAIDGRGYDKLSNQLFSKSYTLYSRIKKYLKLKSN